MSRGWALVVAAVLLVTGCGAGTGGAEDAAVRAKLRQDVAELTQAVAGHDRAAARSALSRVLADSSAAHAAGRLSDDRFARIRTAASVVAGDLSAASPSVSRVSAAPTSSGPASSPAPAGPQQPPAKGGGKGGPGQGGKPKKHG